MAEPQAIRIESSAESRYHQPRQLCTRNDVLNACRRRDIGTLIAALCAQGITQGQLSVLTGIPQGRLSEYKTHKRTPTATSTFEAFADGLGMPPAARRALGLDSETAGSDLSGSSKARLTGVAAANVADVRPVLTTLSRPARSRYCPGSARSFAVISRRTG
jgi:hypothetical protein